MAGKSIVEQQEYGAVAQLVAHLHGMQGVRGSSPLSSTERRRSEAVVPSGRSPLARRRAAFRAITTWSGQQPVDRDRVDTQVVGQRGPAPDSVGGHGVAWLACRVTGSRRREWLLSSRLLRSIG